MAGMLPGVECARRRRFHQSGLFDSSSSITSSTTSSRDCSTRFPSYSLYAPTNHKSPHLSSMQINPVVRRRVLDEKLDETAREAKARLDEKLNTNKGNSKKCERTASKPTKVASKRFSWVAKLRWEGGECAVCLNSFKARQALMDLPCNHRFHSSCLLPWLATNAHCPCCRLQISIE